MVRLRLVLLVSLLGCTPANVTDAEKKRDVTWLANNGSPEAIAALGRVADDSVKGQEMLESMARATVAGQAIDGGASALDVYLAAWGAVERKAAWGSAFLKRSLSDRDRMSDAAAAMKRGSPEVASFVGELDTALKNGCDVRCGAVLASASSPVATNAIEARLADPKTRDAMCAGLGSQEASKEARGVFVRVPQESRNALSCPGAAARMAARADDALAWYAKSAEPGLLRGASTSDAFTCERVARLWSMALATRDHDAFSALAIPLGESVKRCTKALDTMLAGALVADVDSQTLVVTAMDPLAATLHDLPTACAALPGVAQSPVSPPTKARASELLARCK